MPADGDSPTPKGPDPIDDNDLDSLRVEILRLRDLETGGTAAREVLDDRVAELEAQVRDLAATNSALHEELALNPVIRAVKWLAAPIRRRTRRSR